MQCLTMRERVSLENEERLVSVGRGRWGGGRGIIIDD